MKYSENIKRIITVLITEPGSQCAIILVALVLIDFTG